MTSYLHDEMHINVEEDVELDQLICSHNNVEIYKAYWRKYYQVCVKKIKITKDNKHLVERELDILTKCIHPKICQFLGAGKHKDYVYILFEYMENGNLETYLFENTITYEQKEQILLSILIGMNYLSSRTPQKILHRDFKPSNILVNKHGEIKICDFGVSKKLYNDSEDGIKKSLSCGLILSHSPEEIDISITGIGTVRWAAPELLVDSKVIYDERCDIYSFGLLAYFVLTSDIPYCEFKGNLAQIAYSKTTEYRPFLDNPIIQNNKEMHTMIKECTELDPKDRPKDANTIIRKYFHHCITSF